ncbi:hypothetical protein EXM65_18350 [Clostridium botulinum]|uniref:Uncharacterized protein n=1 Tax=Clostridium botulinum TaxID=1491 RepID=A0A6M0ST35_CLOBO|nr:hypothetical protein [Clostridium botulinum]
MNKCIYLKESDEIQTFNKAEHIFPAGIGGVRKLPKGYVSDNVNGIIFSKMELDFMRNSVISICREIEGPGKRGSLSLKKATKSKVGISKDEEGQVKLAYIKKAKPYSIDQIKISEFKVVGLTIGKSEYKPDYENLKEFVIKLERFVDGYKNHHITYIKDVSIDLETILIGEFDSDWYLASNKNEIDLYNVIEGIRKSISYLKNQKSLEKVISKVEFKFKKEFNMTNFFRVCVKMAFNYLAYRTNRDYVCSREFDKLREYVLGEIDEFEVNILENGALINKYELPKRCHTITISTCDENLFAIVSFYDEAFNVGMILSNKADNLINPFIGVCDWKNNNEYDLI